MIKIELPKKNVLQFYSLGRVLYEQQIVSIGKTQQWAFVIPVAIYCGQSTCYSQDQVRNNPSESLAFILKREPLCCVFGA